MVRDEGLDHDFEQSSMFPSSLATFLDRFLLPEVVTAKLPEVGETPSTPLLGEIALSSLFFDYGFRFSFAPFLTRLLHGVWLCPFQLNLNV